MPNKTFLETYPLYKKYKSADFPSYVHMLPPVQINMPCPLCCSKQTFAMVNKYDEVHPGGNVFIYDVTVRLVYKCRHCLDFSQYFFIHFGRVGDDGWAMKVGQFPPWETSGEPNLERLLGEQAGYYKKGLICESQGYGIGAFGYYRRIVEETIDGLLDDVSTLITGAERETYEKALAATRNTRQTSEKIDLVKDLLPLILRPDGMNPLALLHSVLSEGLHAESDEDCLDLAHQCREIILFLVNQIAAHKAQAKEFTESMRKLLDKKASKKPE